MDDNYDRIDCGESGFVLLRSVGNGRHLLSYLRPADSVHDVSETMRRTGRI